MQRTRSKERKPQLAAEHLETQHPLSSGMSSGHVAHLQRTIGNKAVGTMIASHLQQLSRPQLVQREVDYDQESEQFFSTYAPHLKFKELNQAKEFDNVMDTLNRYEIYVDQPLGTLNETSRGRLQSFRTNSFPSWLPESLRQLPIIRKRYVEVAGKIERKRQELSAGNKFPTDMSREEALLLCDRLKQHQISGAGTLEKAVKEAKKGSHLFGYLFQVYDSINQLSEFKLSAVEVAYGEPNPATRHHARADYEMMERQTQEDNSSFYSSQFDMRDKTFVDDKVGYKEPTGESAEGLRNEYKKYAGTASGTTYRGGQPTTSYYGGIEGKMTYKWMGEPPKHFTTHASTGMEQTRAINPNAFASGLTVTDHRGGRAQTLAEPNYDILAEKYSSYISEYLLDQDIFTQLPYTPWQTAKQSMSFQAWKSYLLGVMKEYGIPFPTF